jgi:hypothetical protein
MTDKEEHRRLLWKKSNPLIMIIIIISGFHPPLGKYWPF